VTILSLQRRRRIRICDGTRRASEPSSEYSSTGTPPLSRRRITLPLLIQRHCKLHPESGSCYRPKWAAFIIRSSDHSQVPTAPGGRLCFSASEAGRGLVTHSTPILPPNRFKFLWCSTSFDTVQMNQLLPDSEALVGSATTRIFLLVWTVLYAATRFRSMCRPRTVTRTNPPKWNHPKIVPVGARSF